MLLKRLCWARLQCWVLTEAPTAAEALRRQRQGLALSLAADVKILTALPATLGLTLRYDGIDQQAYLSGMPSFQCRRRKLLMTSEAGAQVASAPSRQTCRRVRICRRRCSRQLSRSRCTSRMAGPGDSCRPDDSGTDSAAAAAGCSQRSAGQAGCRIAA